MNNIALILLTIGIFGGAERRFTKLFEYLSNNHPDKFFFIITWDLYYIIQEIFPDYPAKNLIPIGTKTLPEKKIKKDISKSKTYTISHPGIAKQIYRFIKTYRIQKRILPRN